MLSKKNRCNSKRMLFGLFEGRALPFQWSLKVFYSSLLKDAHKKTPFDFIDFIRAERRKGKGGWGGVRSTESFH